MPRVRCIRYQSGRAVREVRFLAPSPNQVLSVLVVSWFSVSTELVPAIAFYIGIMAVSAWRPSQQAMGVDSNQFEVFWCGFTVRFLHASQK